MLTEFGKIFVFFILGAFFVVGGLVANFFIRPQRPTREKMMIYECGEDAEGESHIKFNLRFYVIALAFLLFDLEFVLLFPWATVFREMGPSALWLDMGFIFILLVGYIYLWKKGDLDWIVPKPPMPDLDAMLIKDKPRFKPTAPEPVKETVSSN